jgi:hypothetical protein
MKTRDIPLDLLTQEDSDPRTDIHSKEYDKPTPESLHADAIRMFGSTGHDPMVDAAPHISRLPEQLHLAVTALVAQQFKDEFVRLAVRMMEDPGWKADPTLADPSRTPRMVASSAGLTVATNIQYLAGQPWHLGDAEILRDIARDIAATGSLDNARGKLMARRPVNIFIGAAEEDDRDSYMKAVTALVRRRAIHNLVLDAELIEWFPELEFQETCRAIGLRPNYVGISERRAVGKHGMLQANNESIPAVLLDTSGRAMTLSSAGAAVSAIAPTPAPAQRPAARPAAPIAQEPVAINGPSTAMKEKIDAMRARQRRKP